MRKLPETFRKIGFDFKVLERHGLYAILSKSVRGEVYGWEVHIVQKNKERHMPNGKIIAEGERLASSEQFGMYAWDFCSFEAAHRKFSELQGKKVPKTFKSSYDKIAEKYL